MPREQGTGEAREIDLMTALVDSLKATVCDQYGVDNAITELRQVVYRYADTNAPVRDTALRAIAAIEYLRRDGDRLDAMRDGGISVSLMCVDTGDGNGDDWSARSFYSGASFAGRDPRSAIDAAVAGNRLLADAMNRMVESATREAE